MMNEPLKVIIKGNEITERSYTPEELQQLEKDKAENAAFNATKLPEETERQAAKAAAEAKLAALGLTADDLKALGL